MNWFSEDYRKVHILYVSPTWAARRGEDFDANEYASQLADAGVRAVELYCKDCHGVCYYPCSSGLPYPRDVVGELADAVRSRGMHFIAYFSVCFDAFALGVHPEWRACDERGVARRQPPFDVACLSSPYADYALKQVDELLSHCPADGLWLDIVPFAWESPQPVWMQMNLPAPCYCMSCRAGYQASTGRPFPGPAPTHEERRATYEYLLGNIGRFIEQARSILEQHCPDAFLTYNGANGPADPLKMADLVSIEGHAPNFGRESFIGRWARGVGKPFEILASGGSPASPTGWNGFDQKPPEVLRVEAALAAAQGGSTVIGQAPYPNGQTALGHYEGFAYAFRPLAALEAAALIHPQSMADVAVVLASRPAVSPETWTTELGGAEAVHRALLDRHIQFDIIPSASNLTRYSVVILADQMVLGDDEVESLRAYVRGGGTLLVIGRVGLIDANGKKRAQMPLCDVLGVRDEGEVGWPFSYLFLQDDRVSCGIPAIPILINHSPRGVEVTGAQVLAELVPPETARTDATSVLWGNPPPHETLRQPGITLATFGSGKACFLPISMANNAVDRMGDTRGLENAWLKLVVQNVVSMLLPEPILTTNAAPSVEVVLNRHGPSRLALQAIDLGPVAPEHLDLGPGRNPGPPWELRLRRQRVGEIVAARTTDGREVPCQAGSDYYLLTLPPVDLHTAVILDLA